MGPWHQPTTFTWQRPSTQSSLQPSRNLHGTLRPLSATAATPKPSTVQHRPARLLPRLDLYPPTGPATPFQAQGAGLEHADSRAHVHHPALVPVYDSYGTMEDGESKSYISYIDLYSRMILSSGAVFYDFFVMESCNVLGCGNLRICENM